MTSEKKIYVAPSILAADFGQLSSEIKRIEPLADFVHVDVMDGHYVPNLSFGLPVIQSIRSKTKLPFDVHLMISNPEKYLKAYADAGSDYITFHVETVDDPRAIIDEIHILGKKAGISIHPDTDIQAIVPFLKNIDLVLIMSVRPGFGGQSFMPEALDRIRVIRQGLDELGSQALLSVDGGISLQTAPAVIAAGANMLVAGSSVFGATSPTEAIESLKKCGK